jgi:hypothetical protein
MSEDANPTKPNTKVCKYWKTCTEEKCTFSHSYATNCYFFSIGTCTKGGNCPFLHLIPKNENKVMTPTVTKESLDTKKLKLILKKDKETKSEEKEIPKILKLKVVKKVESEEIRKRNEKFRSSPVKISLPIKKNEYEPSRKETPEKRKREEEIQQSSKKQKLTIENSDEQEEEISKIQPKKTEFKIEDEEIKVKEEVHSPILPNSLPNNEQEQDDEIPIIQPNGTELKIKEEFHSPSPKISPRSNEQYSENLGESSINKIESRKPSKGKKCFILNNFCSCRILWFTNRHNNGRHEGSPF